MNHSESSPSESAGSLRGPHEPPPKKTPVDRENRVDLVSFYFSQGKSIPQIIKLLERDHGITNLARELPYHDLAYATNAKWLSYSPPKHLELANGLLGEFPFLLEAHIPRAGERMAVVTEAARLVSRSIGHISRKITEEYARDWTFPHRPSEPAVPRRRSRYPNSGEVAEDGGTGTAPEPDPGDPDPLPLVIEIRIGVSGGRTLGATIIELGRILVLEIEDLERDLKEIVSKTVASGEGAVAMPSPLVLRRFRVNLRLLFINLVAGYDTDAFNHPIACVTAMINSHELLISRAEMMCFSASPFVPIGEEDVGAWTPGPVARVKEFVDRYGLDIIITSAGCIDDPHSMMRVYHGNTEQLVEEGTGTACGLLRNQYGIRGDFLWMPITSRAPFSYQRELDEAGAKLLKHRPMTLLDLEDVAEHVRRKHDVVLLLSPCGQCHEPKDQILRAVLEQENPLVTHLVADRRSVARLLGKRGD